MTQMEKSMNRGELHGYKAAAPQPNAMVPGIFNESPLRETGTSAGKSGRD